MTTTTITAEKATANEKGMKTKQCNPFCKTNEFIMRMEAGGRFETFSFGNNMALKLKQKMITY